MSSFFKFKIKPAVYGSKITVTGCARNINGHAAVVSDTRAIYIIDGLQEWQQGWVGHTVKTTGDLDTMHKTTGNDKIIKEAVVVLLPVVKEYDQ
jgi:hypothetical protein